MKEGELIKKECKTIMYKISPDFNEDRKGMAKH
jgi:hypothetical protein